MGALLGYLLGRRREQPDVTWAHQLDQHADELARIIEALEQRNAELWDVAQAADRVAVWVRPQNDTERREAEDLRAALVRADAEAAINGR